MLSVKYGPFSILSQKLKKCCFWAAITCAGKKICEHLSNTSSLDPFGPFEKNRLNNLLLELVLQTAPPTGLLLGKHLKSYTWTLLFLFLLTVLKYIIRDRNCSVKVLFLGFIYLSSQPFHEEILRDRTCLSVLTKLLINSSELTFFHR